MLAALVSNTESMPMVQWKDWRKGQTTFFFRRRNGDDPDVLLKICVTLMIAGANEVHNGVVSLWKQGPSYGFCDYPNFAQFLPKNYFKAFVHAFPFMWEE